MKDVFDSQNPEGLSHLDATGAARMVDVGAKEHTSRMARARGLVRMRPGTRAAIVDGSVPKGDVLATARIAGIMAAKRCAGLIPLCHPLPIDAVAVELEPTDAGIEIQASIKVTARTGAEMEALTAVAVAALTVYDMCKALDRGMEIGDICLEYKEGGKSGVYRREA
ncbi:MAG: cyclic pyranopterin monophosphate synthase MoaC [Actinomycetia bacterium]|nr:cyclic pyranopterin monophosphate synthase MoaC [Actinomycetes bacterium]